MTRPDCAESPFNYDANSICESVIVSRWRFDQSFTETSRVPLGGCRPLGSAKIVGKLRISTSISESTHIMPSSIF